MIEYYCNCSSIYVNIDNKGIARMMCPRNSLPINGDMDRTMCPPNLLPTPIRFLSVVLTFRVKHTLLPPSQKKETQS